MNLKKMIEKMAAWVVTINTTTTNTTASADAAAAANMSKETTTPDGYNECWHVDGINVTQHQDTPSCRLYRACTEPKQPHHPSTTTTDYFDAETVFFQELKTLSEQNTNDDASTTTSSTTNVNLNVMDATTKQSLVMACMNHGKFPYVRYLVLAGADLTVSNNQDVINYPHLNACEIAAELGYSSVIRLCHDHYTTTMDLVSTIPNPVDGLTLFHRACSSGKSGHQGHVQIVQYLLSLGQDLNVKTGKGKTCLKDLVSQSNNEMLELLQLAHEHHTPERAHEVRTQRRGSKNTKLGEYHRMQEEEDSIIIDSTTTTTNDREEL